MRTQPFTSPFLPPPRQSNQAQAGFSTAPTFGSANGLVNAANKTVSWLSHTLYDQGEGVRYLVEQTLGYTVPRTVQQLNRTRSITGESNPLAAMEMCMRDLAADFADTIMPGLLATFAIGQLLDRKNNTYVRRNMGHEALQFYQNVLQKAAPANASDFTNKAEFFNAIESELRTFSNRPHALLNLEKRIHAMASAGEAEKVAHTLARRLRLQDFDLRLTSGADTSVQEFKTNLPHLIRDLWHLNQANPALQSAKTTTSAWGKAMAGLLNKTSHLAKRQMIGNAVALGTSISIPFLIRLMTRHFYGEDAFPGTREIHKHLNTEAPQPSDAPKGFRPFPYLQDTWQEGKKLPTLLTLGFFGVLGGAVTRRFLKNGLNVLKPSHWFNVYGFQRDFPFTTIAQMELTYGALCGFRLAASRDEAEFRESGIRDCILGWPTLTYFFPIFRKYLSGVLDKGLSKQLGASNILIKPASAARSAAEVRTGAELTPSFLKQMGVKGPQAPAALEKAKITQSWVTMASAGVSWVLLALAEPKLGIAITNRMEMAKLKKAQAAQPIPRPPQNGFIPMPDSYYREPVTFSAFRQHQNAVHYGLTN
jgi:hypothetical protein